MKYLQNTFAIIVTLIVMVISIYSGIKIFQEPNCDKVMAYIFSMVFLIILPPVLTFENDNSIKYYIPFLSIFYMLKYYKYDYTKYYEY